MAKFNVGDRVICTYDENSWGSNLKKGKEYTILYYGNSWDGTVEDMVGVSAELPQWNAERFKLVESCKKPSLQSLYEAERDKLTAQQYITTAVWELVVAEKLLEQNTRKAIIEAKRVEVECVRDKLKEMSDLYLEVSNELNEMLRNEPM